MVGSAAAPAVQIIGIGSHHGVDAAGWFAIHALQDSRFAERFPDGMVALAVCDSPAQLPLLTTGARLVIVIDALAGAAAPGTLHCLDTRSLAATAPHASSHDIGIAQMLALIEGLQDCRTLLFGIGTGNTRPTAGQPAGKHLAAAVLDPLARALSQRILQFQCSAQHNAGNSLS